jgi:hypothetical protein
MLAFPYHQPYQKEHTELHRNGRVALLCCEYVTQHATFALLGSPQRIEAVLQLFQSQMTLCPINKSEQTLCVLKKTTCDGFRDHFRELTP